MRTAKKKSLFRFGTLSDLPMDMSKGWKWGFKPLVRGYAEDHTNCLVPRALGVVREFYCALACHDCGQKGTRCAQVLTRRARVGKGALPALVCELN